MLCLRVDLCLGIQGVEHKAGSRGVVDVLNLLQMIRVAADWPRPARLKGSPRRVVEYVARSPVAAAHFTNGLLGENRIDRRVDRLQCSYVPGCRQPEPVAEARGGM
jgi:hypothetical protein